MNFNYPINQTLETVKKQLLHVGKTVLSFFALILLFALLYLTISAARKPVVLTINSMSPEIISDYSQHLHALDSLVKNMLDKHSHIDQSSMIVEFKKARNEYKHIEYLVEYFFRESAIKLNGPNLLEANPSNPNQPLYPTGFQVLEECLFDLDNYQVKRIKVELDGIKYALERLLKNEHEIVPNNTQILHAQKLNIYRLISKGITGFDSPVALNSLNEAKSTLQNTRTVFGYFPESNRISSACTESLKFLEQCNDFNQFDRATFIQKFLNPLCNEIHNYQLSKRIPFQRESDFAINPEASNLFSANAFNVYYFSPNDAYRDSKNAVALGETLFNDKSLSLDQSRSCATCHNPNLAFTDGLQFNTTINSKGKLNRNTPTLINAAFQNVQFMDGRITFLEDQAHAVITNMDEMAGDVNQILERLNNTKEYTQQFKEVLGTKSISERQLKLLLAAYVRSIISFNSRFDKYMRGDETQFSTNEKNGFNLFTGKAKCATCHFVPLFNGSVPPYFDKTESEVLGVPNSLEKSTAKIDSDLGKYTIYKIPHHLYSFKTSTVRNIEFTAPFMHNGVFNTLEEVIEFYEDGGGEAYQFNLENQTLPGDRLNLSKQEKQDLISFLKSLSEETYRSNLTQNP